MTIDRTDLEKIAQLARLELSEEELRRLTRDCQAILAYFEAIRRLDVTDAAPAGALENPAPMREDCVGGDRLERAPADIAPVWREGYFVLPRLPAMDVEAEGAEE
ncbi:MAG: Asp-tRNA(Asn)/Glu-tRNA(Gln) amidotransferase subunit GatC [Gemmatimonadota bacterium]|nr:MAG: Asp-tRNA(Asn)/Glu-tRNA(Gln) amidotransferase subunit GatC [Gemmatimonadota bacterium]